MFADLVDALALLEDEDLDELAMQDLGELCNYVWLMELLIALCKRR